MNNIYDIISRKLAEGNLSAAEQQELDAWLRTPANADEYAELVATWNLAGKAKFNIDVDVDAAWNQFKQKINNQAISKPKGRIISLWSGAVAAAVALIFGIFSLFAPQSEQIILSTTNETLASVLPDGSVVNLNKNTTLVYSYNANKKQRNVELDGEASFAVTHTGDQFVVKTHHNTFTKVLGTEFNVKAYNDSKYIQLSVVSGRVLFGDKGSNAEVVKGQQATFNSRRHRIISVKDIEMNQLGWSTKQFTYNNDPISTIATQMGEYLNLTIVLPTNCDNICYTGKFDNPSAQHFADVIATAMSWTYTISDNKIVFKNR